MSELDEKRALVLKQARSTKRRNALAALLGGGLPGLILGLMYPARPASYGIGLLVGFLWANLFEYLDHRFLLHKQASAVAQGHTLHHAVTGTPFEAEHVHFGESPLHVLLLFAPNVLPSVALELLFGLRIVPGMLLAYALYFIALEEIHWRIHLGGWLPPVLDRARAYHLAHHDRPLGRFNVFLPLIDWLFSTDGDQATLRRAA
jgi:hypothetical protein